MPFTPRVLFRVLVLVCVTVFLTGCVTNKKYRLAKEGGAPEQPLSLGFTAPNAELRLSTVIVFKGPGSWKREAKWDEYVIKLTNRGEQPLTVESAELFDLKGVLQRPGTDPWQLEKLSATNWDKYGSTGVQVLAGAGLAATYVGMEVGAAAGGLMSGGTAAAAGGATVALAVIPVFAVVDITTVAVMNHNNKKKVVAEFDRRRLHLPLTLAPGATVSGSLFFPMTPGPQRLALQGKSGDAPLELVLELKELAGLHLKPKEAKAKAP
jgi:hypothetical protein